MWNWDYAISILPALLKGLITAVQVTLCSFVVACVLGLMLALLRRSHLKFIVWVTDGCTGFIRNTPLLVQVLFLYFSLPMIANVSLPAFTVGVIGLGLHYSTYLSEVYRSGIDSVPRGQWEAARALNYSRTITWTKIILPQAIPPIIPILGNYLLVMFKETPILMAITLAEMLLAAKNLISLSYRPFEAYTIIGILFLLISYPASILIRKVEKRLNSQRGA